MPTNSVRIRTEKLCTKFSKDLCSILISFKNSVRLHVEFCWILTSFRC
eukprot:UN22762